MSDNVKNFMAGYEAGKDEILTPFQLTDGDWSDFDQETIDHIDPKTLPRAVVSTDELYSEQGVIYRKTLDKYATEGHVEEPIVAVKGGKLVIVDGNHRLAEKVLKSGGKTGSFHNVRIFDLDAVNRNLLKRKLVTRKDLKMQPRTQEFKDKVEELRGSSRTANELISTLRG